MREGRNAYVASLYKTRKCLIKEVKRLRAMRRCMRFYAFLIPENILASIMTRIPPKTTMSRSWYTSSKGKIGHVRGR
ncbi:MAG: hypothetical protein QXK88_12080 [Desulfurococcaceae archaeon]